MVGPAPPGLRCCRSRLAPDTPRLPAPPSGCREEVGEGRERRAEVGRVLPEHLPGLLEAPGPCSPSAAPRGKDPGRARTFVMLSKVSCRDSASALKSPGAPRPPLRWDSCWRGEAAQRGPDSPTASRPSPSATHLFLNLRSEGGDGFLLVRVLLCELPHQQRLLPESGEKSGWGRQCREQRPGHRQALEPPGPVGHLLGCGLPAGFGCLCLRGP